MGNHTKKNKAWSSWSSPNIVCLSLQQLDPPQQEQLNAALSSVAQQLPRLADVPWLCPVIDPSDHEVITVLYFIDLYSTLHRIKTTKCFTII